MVSGSKLSTKLGMLFLLLGQWMFMPGDDVPVNLAKVPAPYVLMSVLWFVFGSSLSAMKKEDIESLTDLGRDSIGEFLWFFVVPFIVFLLAFVITILIAPRFDFSYLEVFLIACVVGAPVSFLWARKEGISWD